ncbi:MAG: carbonic anhydrase [Deltaproteobacteria bacterium]|jgi:carbonic anhydrase|nr:carbonic anhydrase [Deltaproteobacteria bacterium]
MPQTNIFYAFLRVTRMLGFLFVILSLCFLTSAALAAEESGHGQADASHGASHGPNNPNSVDSALKALKEGNARFATAQPTHPRQGKDVLAKLAKDGQTPLAAVLSCSDSRAPVEKIFDQGFGDLFVIRVAGAAPGVDQIGSLEYAVAHLGVPIILVLAHTQCGAVTAVVNEAKEPGALGELLAKLNPVAKAVSGLESSARLDAAIKMSASLFREQVTLVSPVIAEAVKAGRLKVVSGVYDIETGLVNFTE